jgi:hypothetical protein
MKHLLSALVMAAMICITAKAEEVIFSFGGTVHELDGEFNYFTGQPFEITYSFNRTTNDANPSDPESGQYIGAIKSGSLTIFTRDGALTWTVKPDGPYNIIEVKNLDAVDSYSASASISGPEAGNEIPASFIIELIDEKATALNNDALPASLKMASFGAQRIVRFTFIGVAKYTFSTIGIITSDNAPIPRDAEVHGEGMRPAVLRGQYR